VHNPSIPKERWENPCKLALGNQHLRPLHVLQFTPPHYSYIHTYSPHMHTRIHLHAHTHTRIPHMHTQTHTHTPHAHIHTHTHTHSTCKPPTSHTHTHTYTPPNMHTHTLHMHIHIHTYIHTRHTQKYTQFFLHVSSWIDIFVHYNDTPLMKCNEYIFYSWPSCFFLLVVLGIKSMALNMIDKGPTTKLYLNSYSCMHAHVCVCVHVFYFVLFWDQVWLYSSDWSWSSSIILLTSPPEFWGYRCVLSLSTSILKRFWHWGIA